MDENRTGIAIADHAGCKEDLTERTRATTYIKISAYEKKSHSTVYRTNGLLRCDGVHHASHENTKTVARDLVIVQSEWCIRSPKGLLRVPLRPITLFKLLFTIIILLLLKKVNIIIYLELKGLET